MRFFLSLPRVSFFPDFNLVGSLLSSDSRIHAHRLYANEIGAVGARAIAEALMSNATLKELEWVSFVVSNIFCV